LRQPANERFIERLLEFHTERASLHPAQPRRERAGFAKPELQRVVLGNAGSDTEQAAAGSPEIHDEDILNLAVGGPAPSLEADTMARIIARMFDAVRKSCGFGPGHAATLGAYR
jgi:hypothetical protein